MLRPAVYLLSLIVVALATPTDDALSLLLYWVPIVVVFELGYYVYRRARRTTPPPGPTPPG
jgi:Sec-independent protein secretion pathway component TatC